MLGMPRSSFWTLLLTLGATAALGAVLDKETGDSPRRLRGKHRPDAAHNHEAGELDYDHDAFLGEELSTQFDALSPEESQRRLGIIVDLIDVNMDGFVNEDEMQKWIEKVQEREIREDTDRQWRERVPDGKEKISWPEYRKTSYGFLEEEEGYKDGFNFTTMIVRDKRRFMMADRTGDKKLNKEEFQAFLHPEDAPYLRDVVVMETMEDMDKDGDGKISITEYMADMWQGKEEEEPDWVKEERDQFHQQRDTNKDGFLVFEEVKDWIVPENFDHTWAEAHHLMVTADDNQDNLLTKEEILNRYDVFVGSQATQFGEILNRHEEF